METATPARPEPLRPRLGLAILTCMDARIDPVQLFALGRGDAHVLRNAGAVVTPDVLRSLALSHHLLGTHEVRVVGHTGCGVVRSTNEDLRAVVGDAAAELDFRTYPDEESLVRAGVQAIADSPLFPASFRASGFVYDVETEELRPVTP